MKSSFFKFICFSLVIMLISSACHKGGSDDGSDLSIGTMTAKVNGVTYTSKVAVASMDSSLGVNLFSIFGISTVSLTSVEQVNITFYLPTNQSLSATSYIYDQNFDDCDILNTACGIIIYSFTNTVDPNANIIGGSSAAGYSNITFSSIDFKKGGHATGTFSSTVLDDDGNSYELTDGQFNVKITE